MIGDSASSYLIVPAGESLVGGGRGELPRPAALLLLPLLLLLLLLLLRLGVRWRRTRVLLREADGLEGLAELVERGARVGLLGARGGGRPVVGVVVRPRVERAQRGRRVGQPVAVVVLGPEGEGMHWSEAVNK